MAEIVLRDVEKFFGENYVIRKLNLTIRHKEFVVLLGPSGCGKTTTLRAIAGLEEIDRGDILIGLIGFNIFSKIKPPPEQEQS